MVKKKLFMPGLLLVLISTANAQSLTYPVGAKAIGSGHTSLVNKDFWSIFNNQAAAVSLKGISTGAFLENRYLLHEMNRIALGMYIPLKQGGMYASIDHFGGGLYSEMKTGIGYAMTFGKYFSAGIQLDYMRMTISEGYGNYHALTFEGGILAKFTDKLSMGIHIFNPVNSKWFGSSEHIPVSIRGGIGFKPDASLSLSAEVHKSTANPAILCVGAEYCYVKKFFIRAGFTSGPSRYTFGAGFKIKSIIVDFASSVHSWLGYSPQLSFTYTINR